MSYFPHGYGTEEHEFKIAEFARMGLMPSSFGRFGRDPYLPHTMWNPSRPDIDGRFMEKLSSPDQKKYRRWSRRLNGQEYNGTGWVLKEEQRNSRREPLETLEMTQDTYTAAYYLPERSPNYGSRSASSPCSESPSPSGSSPAVPFQGRQHNSPHRLRSFSGRRRNYYRKRSKSHAPYRAENNRQSAHMWSPDSSRQRSWHPHSGTKGDRFEPRSLNTPPNQAHAGDDHRSQISAKSGGCSFDNGSSRTCPSPLVKSCADISQPVRSSPRRDLLERRKSQDVCGQGASSAKTQSYETANGGISTETRDEEVFAHKRPRRKSLDLSGVALSPSKKQKAGLSPEKSKSRDVRGIDASPSNMAGSSVKNENAVQGINVTRFKEMFSKIADSYMQNSPMQGGSNSVEKRDESLKLKSKKKRKRNKRSRARRKSKHIEIASTVKLEADESPLKTDESLGTIQATPSKLRSSHNVINSPVVVEQKMSPCKTDKPTGKRSDSPAKRSGSVSWTTPLDPSTFFGPNKDVPQTPRVDSSSDCEIKNRQIDLSARLRVTPDSQIQVSAPVHHRRDSSQSKDESASLNFPRVESSSSKHDTPKNSDLKSFRKDAGRQSRTPTNAVKLSKSPRKNSGDVLAVKTPIETKLGEYQKGSRRPSPSKCELVPKALIKPGLRSAKKDLRKASATKRRSKTPPNSDRKQLVQRTLESYFSKSVTKADSPKALPPTETKQTASEQPQRAPRSTRKTSKEFAEKDATSDMTAPSTSHVRRIYQEEQQHVEARRAVVRLDMLPPIAPSPTRGERWVGTTRLAQVSPILSPAKTCEPPKESPSKAFKSPMKVCDEEQAKGVSFVVHHTEEELAQAQRDEAARAAEAAQRNKKRHSRGHKVYVYCDVLQEDIERHPVQNEIPSNKWSKWMNPVQLRCLVSAMLANTDLCLKFSLEAERNEEWEEAWIKLARRLNTVCYNSWTKLNTGLRMTVPEWKACWLDLKSRVKERTEAMTPKERVHNLGSLECLLISEDLYSALMKSKGECLGKECPRKWCSGACVGVFSPAESIKTGVV